jgi:hypothetical protein
MTALRDREQFDNAGTQTGVLLSCSFMTPGSRIRAAIYDQKMKSARRNVHIKKSYKRTTR